MIEIASHIDFYSNSLAIKGFLKKLYKSYSQLKRQNQEGLSFACFQEVFPIPIFFGKIMFNYFDTERKGYLSQMQFSENLSELYSGDARRSLKIISHCLDSDQDGLIQLDDVKLLLYLFHLSISKKEINLVDQVILKFFDCNSSLSVQVFQQITTTENSDIFILLIFYLSKYKPFSEDQLKFFCTTRMKKLDRDTVTFSSDSLHTAVDDYLQYASEDVLSYIREIQTTEEDTDCGLSILDNFEKDLKSSILTFANEEKTIIDEKEIQNLKGSEGVISLKRINTFFQAGGLFNRKDKAFISCQPKFSSTNYGSTLAPFSFALASTVIDPSVNENIRSEIIVYCTKVNEQLKQRQLVRIGNMLFVVQLRNGRKQRIKAIIPLNLIFIQDECVEVNIRGEKYYMFHLLSHTLKNMTYLGKSKKEVMRFIKETNLSQKCRNFEDDYELKEEIGRGHYGTVVKCKNKSTGEVAAVKCIEKAEIDTPMSMMEIGIFKLFLNASHHGIAKSKDYYETFSHIYLVFELISDGDLMTYLSKRQSALTGKEFLNILLQLALSVSYLHQLGIVHRDIKLENILIRESISGKIELKIIDFGLSKIMGKREIATEQYGSVLYASPEILRGFPYTCKADIWSLGVVVYFLYFGQFPFEDRTMKETAKKIEKCIYNISYSSVINDGITMENDKAIRGIIKCCLQKEALRYNIDQLVDILTILSELM